MELPNIHFQDYPIEFKEINPSDFPNFDVEEKINIEPDSNGFINTALQANIDLYNKNTFVINAAVGQGKTFSIIEIINKYYEAHDDYIIFVAVPFVSLVQQYFNKLVDIGIPKAQIYSYDYIGTEVHLDAWSSKIQIVTVNCLLGNPGEDSFEKSEAKKAYINYLVDRCEVNNKKVVFIYDEIHDAIHNFKEEFVFNLWKWRQVIHKNILLSATYNEASKVVVEYLAELTENRIKILESTRKRFVEKQSDLYLHYDKSRSYRFNNDGLVNLTNVLISEGKQIDILTFSKTLADDICLNTEEGVGKLLFETFGELQNCTSELISNQRPNRDVPKNRYDPSKCNVGTNFKTGISIEKDNHAFIIIMPPVGRKGTFKRTYGIFTDGVNSIIQSLARQRTKGEIHIILPPPDKFDFETLPFQVEALKDSFMEFYISVQNNHTPKKLTEYIPLNRQGQLVKDFYYNSLKANIQSEIEFIQNADRLNRIRLEYPEYKLFLLNKGEKYLSSKFKFFGEDLSSYITYCAFTNQFINCKLAGVKSKPVLFFQAEKTQWKLERFFYDNVDEDFHTSLYLNVNDTYKYFDFKKSIFNDYKILYKQSPEQDYNEISSLENKTFEKQLIAFLQRKIYPKNHSFNSKFNDNGYFVDADYNRGDYFLSCIAHSIILESSIESLDSTTRELVVAYKSLNYFRSKLLSSIQTITVSNIELQYVSINVPDLFISTDEQDKFTQMIEILTAKDYFIVNNIFDFKLNFLRTENQEIGKQIKAFYKYLKSDFLIGKRRRISNSVLDENVTQILSIIDLPEADKVLDMISTPAISTPEEYLQTLEVTV